MEWTEMVFGSVAIVCFTVIVVAVIIACAINKAVG